MLDRTAVHELEDSCPRAFAIDGGLDLLLAAGKLGVPKAVFEEVEARSGGESGPFADWFRRSRGRGEFGEPSDETISEVLGQVKEAIDHDSKRGDSAASVLAMAQEISELEEEVFIVTEDTKPKPNKKPMKSAAAALKLKTRSVAQFANEEGLG